MKTNQLSSTSRSRAAIAVVIALAAAATLVAQDKTKPAASATKPAVSAAAAGPAGTAEQKYKTNVKGPANAPIKVVEFADFMCPGCQAASVALRSYFAQQGPDINLTFKNYPLEKTCNSSITQTVHTGACELALGAVCASELGEFWGYHDRIFSRSWQVATRQDVLDNAVAVGIDKTKMQACMESTNAKSKLAIQIKEGIEADVRSTPTLVINGKKLEQTNFFVKVVDEERKKLAAAPATK